MNLGKEIKDEIESKGKKIIKMKEEKLARTNKIGGSESSQTGRIMTSIEGLDKMLKGGLLPGRNVLLSGPCGSGKTTIAMQFVCNGAILHNEKSLYVTL